LQALFSTNFCYNTTRPNLLDCKLSALDTYRQYHIEKEHDHEGQDGLLTARTLKRDVLPAFWRPIIVTSISVALKTRDMPRQEVGMENSKDNIPEQAEKPVIETFEEACHGEVFGRLGTAGKCRRAGTRTTAVEQLDGCTGRMV
jgi:hypothetical protein